MQSTIEKLKAQGELVTDLGYKMYTDAYSRLNHWPVNQPGDMVAILGMGDWVWSATESGEPIRVELLHQLGNLKRLVLAIEREPASSAMLEEIQQSEELLIPESRYFLGGLDNAGDTFGSHIDKVCEHAEKLTDRFTGECLLVADTNALLSNIDLESWRFDDIEQFTFMLVPQVLSELEDLKTRADKAESVREKCKKLIRRLKEYRRRGKLTEGVTIVGGKIRLLASAVEPNFANNLPWLVPTHSDDRILACAVEVVRAHPKCAVAIVTNDFNFQTKIEFAQLDYLEAPAAPEPPSAPE